MARMEFDGLDGIVREMEKLQTGAGPAAEKMLRAGAEVLAEYRRREAEKRGLRDMGEMIKNIKPDRKAKTVNGVMLLTVYSRGTDKNPHTKRRNAEKEFVNHYGYKSKPATHWIESAEKDGEGPAQKEMVKIWDGFIDSGTE